MQPNYPPGAETEEEQQDEGGFNWVGIVIFLLVVGSQFLQPLLNYLGQFIGQGAAQRVGGTLTNWLPMLVVGFIGLTIVIAVVRAIAGGVSRIQQSTEGAASPSNLPEQMRMPSSTFPDWASGGSHTTSSGPRSTTTSYIERLERMQHNQGEMPANIGPATVSNSDIAQLPRGMRPAASDLYTMPRDMRPSSQEVPDVLRKVHAPSSFMRNGRLQTPGFEPIIDGTILTLGILAILVLVGLVGAVVVFAGIQP